MNRRKMMTLAPAVILTGCGSSTSVDKQKAVPGSATKVLLGKNEIKDRKVLAAFLTLLNKKRFDEVAAQGPPGDVACQAMKDHYPGALENVRTVLKNNPALADSFENLRTAYQQFADLLVPPQAGEGDGGEPYPSMCPSKYNVKAAIESAWNLQPHP